MAIQASFFQVDGNAIWQAPPAAPDRGRRAYPLTADVTAELHAFEGKLLREGRVSVGTAKTYRKALACVVKQAQRHVGHKLESIWQLFELQTVVHIVRDEVPFDEITDRLGRQTLMQRRVVMRAFLRSMSTSPHQFRQLDGLLDDAFRQAAVRRGQRYVIAAGRKMRGHRCPSVEEMTSVIGAAGRSPNFFTAARNQAVLLLMLATGMRSVSLLSMDCADFEWRRGTLLLHIKEKGRAGKRPVSVQPAVVVQLQRYVEAHNAYSALRGWTCRIGLGGNGPFWRGSKSKKLTYSAMLQMTRATAAAAGVEDFHLHGIRHLRASQLGAVLSSADAAAAGGWRSQGVYERHYAESLRFTGPQSARSAPPAPEAAAPSLLPVKF